MPPYKLLLTSYIWRIVWRHTVRRGNDFYYVYKRFFFKFVTFFTFLTFFLSERFYIYAKNSSRILADVSIRFWWNMQWNSYNIASHAHLHLHTPDGLPHDITDRVSLTSFCRKLGNFFGFLYHFHDYVFLFQWPSGLSVGHFVNFSCMYMYECISSERVLTIVVSLTTRQQPERRKYVLRRGVD